MRTEIHREIRPIIVNDRSIDVTLVTSVSQDDIDPAGDFDFGDEKENEDYLARFECGELFVGVVWLHAYALGVTASDTLSGCHLSTGNTESEALSIVREYGMDGEVLREMYDQVSAIARVGRMP